MTNTAPTDLQTQIQTLLQKVESGTFRPRNLDDYDACVELLQQGRGMVTVEEAFSYSGIILKLIEQLEYRELPLREQTDFERAQQIYTQLQDEFEEKNGGIMKVIQTPPTIEVLADEFFYNSLIKNVPFFHPAHMPNHWSRDYGRKLIGKAQDHFFINLEAAAEAKDRGRFELFAGALYRFTGKFEAVLGETIMGVSQLVRELRTEHF